MKIYIEVRVPGTFCAHSYRIVEGKSIADAVKRVLPNAECCFKDSKNHYHTNYFSIGRIQKPLVYAKRYQGESEPNGWIQYTVKPAPLYS